MLIFTEVLSTNLYKSRDELVEMAKREGGLYGDQGRYISTDCPTLYDWAGHTQAEANNLLKLFYGPNPESQQFVIDVFKIVPLTVDQYLSKRAFADEYSFSSFTSTMLSWISEVKNIYEKTTFLSYIGTTRAEGENQNVKVQLPAEPAAGASQTDMEAYERIVAQTIAKEMADLIVDIEDVNRDFNDLEHLHSYNINDFVFVWNSEWVNRINKLDVPTIFNKEGLIDKFAEYVRPAKFFGDVNGDAQGAGIGERSRIAKDFNLRTVNGVVEQIPMNDPTYDKKKLVFGGDLIPSGVMLDAGESYTENPNIICKIYHKKSVPMLVAFSTMTDFYNGSSLTNTHRLIFGHSTLDYVKDLPFITVEAELAE
jgi:hypothetical protein